MSTNDTSVNFGYKCLWIAVKTGDKEKVAIILKLKNITPCNWKNGIDQAYQKKVFISPRVDQWTLAIGWGLANPNSKSDLDDVKYLISKIDSLSKEFGEAQVFLTYRVPEYHMWGRSINGQTVRLYSYIGERNENILILGQPTEFEKQFNLVNTFSKEAKDD